MRPGPRDVNCDEPVQHLPEETGNIQVTVATIEIICYSLITDP